MENYTIVNPEKDPSPGMKDRLLVELGLTVSENINGKNYYKLPEDFPYELNEESLEIDSPEVLASYFEDCKLVQQDSVCRAIGDTTLFTTSGVQKIETLADRDGDLEKDSFICIQPVIRSQFMDKVKEGTSSSFVNFSLEIVDCSQEDFLNTVKRMISFFSKLGIKKDDLSFTLKEDTSKWGDKKFEVTPIKIYVNGSELTECVYMHDYPVSDTKRISITDFGFGVERLGWGIRKNPYYMQGFEDVYKENESVDSNEIAGIIDPIRSMVLIAGEDVTGSNKNHGYRLRQLSKRFIERNRVCKIDEGDLVARSLSYWKKWGHQNTVSDEDVERIVTTENQRNYNMLFLSTLNARYNSDLYIEINQPTEDFLKQIRFSVSDDKISDIIQEL